MLGESAGIDFGCLEALLGGILGRFWVILCVASVIRCIPVLFQLRPKFGPIPDQLLFYRLCLTPVALPSVAGAVVSRSVLNYFSDPGRSGESPVARLGAHNGYFS